MEKPTSIKHLFLPSTEFTSHRPKKITLQLRAVGTAPLLKVSSFTVSSSSNVHKVLQFLKKQLGYPPSQPLFLQISGSFTPSGEETMGNLYQCYGTGNNTLVMVYGITSAC